MDDDDVPCGEFVVVFCCTHSHSHSHSGSGSGAQAGVSCCCCVITTIALALLLILAFAFVVPVRVTVDEATLGHLALAVPAPDNGTNGNGTGTAAAVLSYDFAAAVALHNHNWAMALWRRGPLDAELRFRGRTLARSRLAGGAGRDMIRSLRMELYHLAAAGESAPVALGPGDAAELARERAAGVFELELAVFGEVQYEAHPRRRAINVTCPLRLSPSTATSPAAFARVKCA